jgi:hypothetical protein
MIAASGSVESYCGSLMGPISLGRAKSCNTIGCNRTIIENVYIPRKNVLVKVLNLRGVKLNGK